MKQSKHVRVVGAGPAGLMAAQVLSKAGVSVTIVDHHRQPARKLLLAGRGGLNLSHSEALDRLLPRYGEAQSWLEPVIRAFPPTAVQKWCEDLGIKTFIGSSGRIFPICMKASPVLRAWMRKLSDQGVTLQSNVPWTGFDDLPTILALGGASWPELGSNAAWVPIFETAGVAVTPLKASNGRVPMNWTEIFINRCAGQPIKNVAVSVGNHMSRGEIMIARDGIEGGAIYASSRALRETSVTTIEIDLKPDLSEAAVQDRLQRPRGKDSRSTYLRKVFHLSPPAISLMREVSAENPKHLTLKISGDGDVRRAISTAGGVSPSAFNQNFQLHKFPNTFVVGEMLDWDAPTGGYLLQACLATGHWAAQRFLDQ